MNSRSSSASFSIKPSHRYVNPQSYDFEYNYQTPQENVYHSSLPSVNKNNKKQTSTPRMASSSIQVKEIGNNFSIPFSSTQGTTSQGSTQGMSIKLTDTSVEDFY